MSANGYKNIWNDVFWSRSHNNEVKLQRLIINNDKNEDMLHERRKTRKISRMY